MLRPALALALLTLAACSDPDGDGFRDAKDCAPYDQQIQPDAEEICDGIDNDCDGWVDEGVSLVAYWDRDGDGYGSPEHVSRVCSMPEDGVDNGDDCLDTDPASFPGAAEVCDAIDNDCDGEVDEGVTSTFYLDEDGDGHGTAADTLEACWAPAGYSPFEDDCDDADANAWTDAPELCDDLDNDCDGEVDEDLELTRVWVDADGDGHGDPEQPALACGPVEGFSADAEDCDDSDPDRGPQATEIAGNGEDEDCDGYIDEIAVPDHHATLADALAAASTGDVVQLAEGTWYDTVDMSGQDITLAGEGCDTVLYGDGAGTVVTADRGRIEHMALAGGRADYGGGLLVQGEVEATDVCVLASSAQESGGGIAVLSGTLTLSDSLVSRNSASIRGGGIYVFDGARLDATRTSVTGNQSRYDGGGLMLDGARATLSSLVFADNSSSSDGGAIATARYQPEEGDARTSTLTGTNLTLSDNRTTSRGGALFNAFGEISLTNVLVSYSQGDIDNALFYDYGATSELSSVGLWLNDSGDETRHGYVVDAVRGDPAYVDRDAVLAEDWDLHLTTGSPFVDAGDPDLLDPDGSPSDLGAFGGPDAAWDFDRAYAWDSDSDGLPDGWEVSHGLNPWVDRAADDPDADGLSNSQEYAWSSNPQLADTDADGVSDGDEVAQGTDPADARDQRPLAHAGQDTWVIVGEPVIVDGSGSYDPNDDALTAAWTLSAPGGSALTAVDSPASLVSGFTPDAPGTYSLQLTVADAAASSSHEIEVVAVEGLVVPDDLGTIQEAVDASSSGDWVLLRPGTYAETVDLGGTDLHILGLGEPEEVVVDGQTLGSVITAADGEELWLGRLTLTGGSAALGGCVYSVTSPSVELVEVVLSQCEASVEGGAIYAESGESLRLVRVDVSDSSAESAGGAVASRSTPVEVEGSRFTGNRAEVAGGALWLDSGTYDHQVRSSVFQANRAPLGAAFFHSGSQTAVRTDNLALVVNEGEGAVYVEAGEAHVLDALVLGHREGSAFSRDALERVDVLYPLLWDNGTLFAWEEDQSAYSVEAEPLVAAWTDDGLPDNDVFAPRPGSPLIDAGHPERTDVDGSRVDIGPWGGEVAPRGAGLFTRDADGDGMSDGWELLYDLDPTSDDSALDADGDGLTNAQEYGLFTDPSSQDSDSDGVSDDVEVSVGSDPSDPSDNRPVADAGEDLTAETFTVVSLDGSDSSDPNGDSLSFAWTFSRVPADSALTDADITDATTATPSFEPDARGTFRLALEVDDGSATSLPDRVEVVAYGDLHVPSDYATIEDALADLGENDSIVLAAGEYEASVDSGGISFTLEGVDRDSVILTPPRGEPAVNLENEETVTIRGLTLQGAASKGGAILCDTASLVLDDMALRDNAGYQGGALAAWDCAVTISDSWIEDNEAQLNGGALYLYDSTLDWSGGRADGNTSGNAGAVAYLYRTDTTMEGVVLSRNTNDGSASIYLSYGTLEVHHITAAGNDNNYGVFFMIQSDATIHDSLFVDNQSYGIYRSSSSSGYLLDVGWDGFYGNSGTIYPSSFTTGLDHVMDDPLLVSWDVDQDREDDDLRLTEGSPMVNAGDPSAATDPDGSTADIGAYGGASAPTGWSEWLDDTDGDGMSDGWEAAHGLDPVDGTDGADDDDGDGLTNAEEYGWGCDPADTDSDDDGVEDGDEVDGGTDPAESTDFRPVADAGTGFAGPVGTEAVLDGSGSYDPNGDSLSYAWTFSEIPGTSTLTDGDIDGSTTSAPSFTPDTAGVFVVQLVVSDASADSLPDTTRITVPGDLMVPDDYASVEEALDALVSGYAIEIDEGTWPCSILLDGKDVTLQGAGRDLTFLDAEGLGSVVWAGEAEVLVLQDLTLTGGLAPAGGAIYAEDGSVVLDSVALDINDGVSGGAVYLDYASLSGTDVRLTDNVAARYGGGIYGTHADVELYQALVAGNASSGFYGGGLYLAASDLVVEAAVFSDNMATHGAGIYLTGSGSTASTATLSHVTATHNQARTAGDFLRQASAAVTLDDSIVAHNGPSGDAIALTTSTSNSFAQTYSLVYDNDPDDYNGTTDPTGTNGNISSDPLLVDLSDDADWTNDDWTLDTSSPAEDAADPSGALDPDGSDPDMGAFGGAWGNWSP